MDVNRVSFTQNCRIIRILFRVADLASVGFSRFEHRICTKGSEIWQILIYEGTDRTGWFCSQSPILAPDIGYHNLLVIITPDCGVGR